MPSLRPGPVVVELPGPVDVRDHVFVGPILPGLALGVGWTSSLMSSWYWFPSFLDRGGYSVRVLPLASRACLPK